MKPRLFIFTDWYLPGYKAGGPISTISNIAKNLGEKCHVFIITRDHDLGGKEKYKNIEKDQWVKLFNYRVFYKSGSILKIFNIISCINNKNRTTIYLNSFFSPQFSILILLLCKIKILKPFRVVLSPRGELHKNAIRYKYLKKKIFLIFDKIVRLHSNIIWQVSNDQERREVFNLIGNKASVKIIPDMILFTAKSEDFLKKSKSKGELKMIFLSRIHPTKNLHYALETIAKSEINVQLDIYGPLEVQSYWQQCQKVMQKIQNKSVVTYKGELKKERVLEKLKEYHMLFFPTQSENFGHVIFESLSVGTPVIISDRTPWQNLELSKAGWQIQLDKQNLFLDALKRVYEMDQKKFNEWSIGAYNYAKDYYEKNNNSKEYIKLFFEEFDDSNSSS